MDELGLQTLHDELIDDCRVATAALAIARQRLAESSASALEGCAHHLARIYNVIEQMSLRVAGTFENRIADDGGWHAEPIARLSLRIEGVRPALFPVDLRQPLRERRGFRQMFTHAYELDLDCEKLVLLLKYADRVVPRLSELCEAFVRQVAEQEGLGRPPES
jgi:hypothetical protein